MLQTYELLIIFMGVLVIEGISAIYKLTNKILSERPIMFSDPEQLRLIGILTFTALTTIIPIYSSILLFNKIQQNFILAIMMTGYLVFSVLVVRRMKMEVTESLSALVTTVSKISLKLEENIDNIPYEKRKKAKKILHILSSANALFTLIDEIKKNLSLARKYLGKDHVKALKNTIIETELNCVKTLRILLAKNVSAYRFASDLGELEEVLQGINENYSTLSIINEKLINLIAEESIKT